MIATAFQPEKVPAEHFSHDETAEKIAKVIQQMKRRCNVTVKLDEWAEYVSIGKYDLISGFKQYTRIPPMAFHNAEKLELAKHLLVFENMNVTDVCYEIGFESLGSFVSKFSKCVGISPGNYAQAMRKSSFLRLFSATLSNHISCARDSENRNNIRIKRPAGGRFDCFVAAVFDKPYPSGMPTSWKFVSPFTNEFFMNAATGKFCLISSLPVSPDLSLLVNFRPKFVGRTYIVNTENKSETDLRAYSHFDPPISLALPALLCREANSSNN